MAEGGSNLFIKRILGSQVVWAGPKSQKSKEKEGNKSNKDGDKESHVEGTHEVGGSSSNILFERKRRNSCEGDYARKPPRNARPTVHFLPNDKGFAVSKHKKTLALIFRMKFDEQTIWTKGASREAFYTACIKNFKEYYVYPHGYDDEDGDEVVRAYLHRNWKSYLGAERSRLREHVTNLVQCGYTAKDFNIRDEGLKPYYFSQRTWNSICDYWEDEVFGKLSINGKNARSKVEFVSRSGAKPYEQRRQEINEEREAKGKLPMCDEEFMGIVYDPTQPAVQDLQEKVKKARAELAPKFEKLKEPESPRSKKEFHLKQNVSVLARARSPNKGIVNLYPQSTVAELLGARDALQIIKKQKIVNSQSAIDIPDEVYMMMSEILDAVTQIVCSLPTREVKQCVLDVEVRKLAAAALPNPSQQSIRNHYIRTASGLLGQILKANGKIIVEEIVLEEQVVADNNCNNEDDVRGDDEYEDLDADNYPLI